MAGLVSTLLVLSLVGIIPPAVLSEESGSGIQNCTTSDVRLSNGRNSDEGLLEICGTDKTWKTVCTYDFSCSNAEVVCRQLGYTQPLDIELGVTNGAEYGTSGTSDPIQVEYNCQGTETSLMECSQWVRMRSWCWAHISVALKCRVLNIPDYLMCTTHGDVRLIGGKSPGSGVVQICSHGVWRILCSRCSRQFEKVAEVVCRQLGFNTKWVSIFYDGRYYNHIVPLVRTGLVTCSGNEANIAHCKLSSCMSSECYEVDAGIKCDYNESECINGSVRLMGGSTMVEGRLEMCVDGVWGIALISHTINIIRIFIQTANVACRQLGFSAKANRVLPFSPFGDGDGPVVYSEVNCHGNEKSVFDCRLSQQFSNFLCGSQFRHYYTLSIRCTDDCTDGSVRLIGGCSQEGTVELCVHGVWNLIGDDSWDDLDATVICTQLGFEYTHAVAVSSSFYGRSHRKLHYNWVECTGTETNITQCSHGTVDDDNREKCAHVAGVICRSRNPPTNDSCVFPTYGSSMSVLSGSGGFFAGVATAALVATLIIVIGVVIKRHRKHHKDVCDEIMTDDNSAYGKLELSTLGQSDMDFDVSAIKRHRKHDKDVCDEIKTDENSAYDKLELSTLGQRNMDYDVIDECDEIKTDNNSTYGKLELSTLNRDYDVIDEF